MQRPGILITPVTDDDTNDVIGWDVILADFPDYQSINTALGGWIEAVPTDERVTIYVNEEGKLLDLPANPIAYAFWQTVDTYHCTTTPGWNDWIAGPAVILGGTDDEGETLPVPADIFDWFSALQQVPA